MQIATALGEPIPSAANLPVDLDDPGVADLAADPPEEQPPSLVQNLPTSGRHDSTRPIVGQTRWVHPKASYDAVV